ncbi:MAG: glutaredoxin family protein [Anaerolineae bacterium]
MGSRRAVRLTFYTKEDCRLCDDAKLLLQSLQGSFSIEVDEVDIASKEHLERRFGEVVPVVKIEGGPSLFGKIDGDRLRQAVSLAAVAGGSDRGPI